MLRVRLFQDHQAVFEGVASHIVLPGDGGELSVLDYHAPMLCVLSEGDIYIDEARFGIHGGIVSVARNFVTIMTH